MTALLQTAQSARDAAQTALDTALASGDDVTDARQRLADAEAAIVGLQEAQREAEAAEAAEVEAQADALVEATRAECSALIDSIFEKIKPTLPVDPDRSNLMVLVQAQRRHSDSRDVLTDAQGRVDALTERRADLQTERESIVGRRARGDCRDTDRGDVELIAVDLEGIESALSRLTKERDRLAGLARESRASLTQAENLVAGDREQAIQKSLREAQAPIEDALVQVAREFKRNSTTNHAPWWVLNVELKNLTRPR